MWNHVSVIAIAAAASLGAAQGVVTLHDWSDLQHGPRAAALSAPFRDTSTPAAIAKAPDGHYWAEATVDGRQVRLLVDTGATEVALTTVDARRLGLDLSRLDYKRTVRTAAGETRAAEVELGYVSVAGARVEKVSALVLEGGLETSLLGMTYLGRLSSFEAHPDSLILRP